MGVPPGVVGSVVVVVFEVEGDDFVVSVASALVDDL